jgi:hypothetical protein
MCRMKETTARIFQDLLAKTNGRAIYEFARDGHSNDLAEVLSALEHRMQSQDARQALINFAWMLIEARPARGADEARRRDELKDEGPDEFHDPAPLTDILLNTAISHHKH